MTRWISTCPKPRLNWCWACGNRLHGRQHVEREIGGARRILHVICAQKLDAGELIEDVTESDREDDQ
jgi:hypothetical protein